jgi:hypothetical protein
MTYPSEHGEVIVSAECFLDVSSAVHAQCDRDRCEGKEQQVNRKDLYAASCRFQSHSGLQLMKGLTCVRFNVGTAGRGAAAACIEAIYIARCGDQGAIATQHTTML